MMVDWKEHEHEQGHEHEREHAHEHGIGNEGEIPQEYPGAENVTEEDPAQDGAKPRRGWFCFFMRKAEDDLEHGLERVEHEAETAVCSLCGTCPQGCLCQELFSWFGFLGITYAFGWLTGLFMHPESFEWLAGLNRPESMPPRWLFMPVWITLYFLLGTGVWMVWKKAGCHRIPHVLVLFAFVLLMQVAWSYTFFYHQNLFGGFVNLIWMFLGLVLLAASMIPYSRLGAALLLPQILWTIYAMALNYSLWRLN